MGINARITANKFKSIYLNLSVCTNAFVRATRKPDDNEMKMANRKENSGKFNYDVNRNRHLLPLRATLFLLLSLLLLWL